MEAVPGAAPAWAKRVSPPGPRRDVRARPRAGILAAPRRRRSGRRGGRHQPPVATSGNQGAAPAQVPPRAAGRPARRPLRLPATRMPLGGGNSFARSRSLLPISLSVFPPPSQSSRLPLSLPASLSGPSYPPPKVSWSHRPTAAATRGEAGCLPRPAGRPGVKAEDRGGEARRLLGTGTGARPARPPARAPPANALRAAISGPGRPPEDGGRPGRPRQAVANVRPSP